MSTLIHREGPIAAGDTRTAITAQGATAAPGVIKVPPWAHKIVTVIASVGDNTSSGADGGMNYLITISGDGMVEGDQTMLVGASFCDFTTAGDSGFGGMIHESHDVDIDVEPNGIVNLYAEGTLGVLVGLPEFGITIQFQ